MVAADADPGPATPGIGARVGLRSSHTAETWVTVTSSRTPNEPMITRRQQQSSEVEVGRERQRLTDSSDARPVRCAADENTAARAAVRPRLANVPRTATVVRS